MTGAEDGVGEEVVLNSLHRSRTSHTKLEMPSLKVPVRMDILL
jgi:hypothetical protein